MYENIREFTEIYDYRNISVIECSSDQGQYTRETGFRFRIHIVI